MVARVVVVVLFVGDDWAEAHHDVELMDATGRRLVAARLPDGVAGVTRLHALIAEQLAEPGAGGGDDEARVVVGIETGRGPWVQALLAAGYAVFAVNPLSVARFRERHGVSGAKSDAADAHLLADMVRTDSHQLRPLAADSALAEAVKVVARAHKTLIWERTRHVLRLRRALLDYFPAAVEAFDDLAAPDTLQLLAQAPDPAAAAGLSRARIRTALNRAHRRDVEAKAARIQTVLRADHLTQPAPVAAAYAASTLAEIAILAVLAEQISALQGQVEACFGRHPDADIICSQPGLGPILGARVLAEFGDDPHRYRDAKARKNYAGTSPITRASGKKRTITARHVHNNWLIDALTGQAFSALSCSPGARAYYDQIRTRGISHQPALRQLANRLVGILHGCLTTHTPYNETTAWPQQTHQTHTAA